MSRLAIPLLFFCCAVLMPTGSAPAAPTTVPAAASRDMADAAGNLLAALTPDQKKQIRFEFSDVERFNWHFVPRARKGLPLKSMTPAQRHLAQALLASGLSQRGYISAVSIMSLEDVLKEMEKGKGPARDPELYFVSLFGDPGQGRPWGWRVEGHHISLNFTIVSGTVIASAPAFFGSNPGRVPDGPRKDLRILAQEEDFGRQLITSMNETQRKAAILPIAAPREIVTGNSRKATIDPAGIEFSSLGAPQQHLLMALVGLYANRLRTELAAHDLERITSAGIERIRFAWAGALESGKPHYYRIHGPTFLIEYDDTQNEANHIHTVWRDLEHDFGEDLLHEHYEEHARDPAHGH